MNRECPVCHHQAPFDSPYCPACGAPMQKASEEGRPSQGEAIIRQVSQAQKSISPLPMKWHSFLKFVSIPFSFVLAAVNLIQEIKELSAFNAANYYPQAAEAVRLSLQVGIAVNAALLCIQILAVSEPELAEKLAAARKKAAEKVLAADAELSARFNQ